MHIKFSYFYLSLIFLSIVCRIEFWPFSDFGVFKYAEHPNKILVYRLALYNENGERSWLYREPWEIYKNSQLNDSIHFLRDKDRMLPIVEEHLPVAKQLSNGSYSYLMLYTRRLEPEGSGYRIVDDPTKAISLQ